MVGRALLAGYPWIGVCSKIVYINLHLNVILGYHHSMVLTTWYSIQIGNCKDSKEVIPWSHKKHTPYLDGILPKVPYPPSLRMADRAPLAGYPWSHPHRHIMNCPLWIFGAKLTVLSQAYPYHTLNIAANCVASPNKFFALCTVKHWWLCLK